MRKRLLVASSGVLVVGLGVFTACGGSSGSSGSPDASAPAADSAAPDASMSGDTGATEASDDGGLFAGPDAWNLPVTRPSDDAAVSARAACTFARGAMPAATLGASTPVDTDIPIDNIVVVMMENRSFDSMFGHLNEYGNRTDVQEPAAGASNPSQAANWNAQGPIADGGGADSSAVDGGAVDGGAPNPWMHATSECFADTDHNWAGQHWAWDYGRNDGFYAENNGYDSNGNIAFGAQSDGERAMWWYDQTDLPFDYQLANTFAIADNYFCSLLGPTYPNRLYLVAGTSFGVTNDSLPLGLSSNLLDNVVVPDELQQRNVTWGTYGDGASSLLIALTVGIATRYPQPVRFSFEDFVSQAASGTLPQVVWLDPNIGTSDGTVTNNDDHPPSDPQIGSQFLSQVYHAVTTSPQWAHTALFITWDENGGEYDHLPPAPACAPDTKAPILVGNDQGTPGDFTRYGFRVPLIVVSPYAKKGYASHNVYDHTSIARFIEAKFKIPALTARDANADALMDLFDFSAPPAFATPPSIPVPTVDDAGLAACEKAFGP
jgi:phospholipase C